MMEKTVKVSGEFIQLNQLLKLENIASSGGEAKAMIDAEKSSPGIRACMITKWREARRKVILRNIDVRLPNNGGLNIVFYEFDSDFDGNDFQYKYSLDSSNPYKFIKMLPHISDELMADIEECLIGHIQCEGTGLDLQQKWIQMGLHGKRIVSEDYPGGIYREEAF